MKKFLIIFSIMTLALTTFTVSINAQSKNINSTEAAPSNDNFAGATPMFLNNGSAAITTTNVDASKEQGEPNHAENAGGRSVWFSFTPTATTAIRINLTFNTFDTLLAVYQGSSVNNLTLVGYNDDCTNTCEQASTVDLMVTAGQTYYMAVDGLNDGNVIGAGNFKIAILDLGTPLQDNFLSAQPLGSSHSGSIAGTNYNATREANEPVHYINPPNGKSVWYRWTASGNFSVAFELSENFDSQIAVYTSNVGNPTFAQLTKVASSPDYTGYTDSRYRTTFFAQNGKTYYIAIDWHHFANNDISEGNFQLKFYPNKMRYSTKFTSFGDKSSLSIYRPSESTWYNITWIDQVNPNIYHFGLPGDTPMPADYKGDGITRMAVVRNENGKKVWYIGSGGSSFDAIQWGVSTDKVATGDFDKDGRADLLAIRNSAQGYIWYIRKSSDGGLMAFTFGTTGDKPVIGDFDGDGFTDVVVTRNTQNGIVWHMLKSGYGNGNGQPLYSQYSALQFGVAPDVATAEDFDGDGKTDIAVWRPSTGVWYILRSSDNQVDSKAFGLSGDKPQPADYDGDGKADIAVFRPSDGLWYIVKSGDNQWAVISWGVSTDVPATSLSMLVQ